MQEFLAGVRFPPLDATQLKLPNDITLPNLQYIFFSFCKTRVVVVKSWMRWNDKDHKIVENPAIARGCYKNLIAKDHWGISIWQEYVLYKLVWLDCQSTNKPANICAWMPPYWLSIIGHRWWQTLDESLNHCTDNMTIIHHIHIMTCCRLVVLLIDR